MYARGDPVYVYYGWPCIYIYYGWPCICMLRWPVYVGYGWPCICMVYFVVALYIINKSYMVLITCASKTSSPRVIYFIPIWSITT
jgi:hypothetical protein